MQPLDVLSRSWSPCAARGLFVSSVLCNAVIACGPEANPATTGTTTGLTTGLTTSTTSDPASATGASDPTVSIPGTTTGTPTSTSEALPTTGGNNFINFDCGSGIGEPLTVRCQPDNLECDVFLQDCKGENEKCEAVITDGGGAWNSSKCVPVSGTDTPGDACTAESVADGLDSCVKGAMCWGVDMDGNGTCVALCMGSADAPICPNNGPCTITNDGFLNLCLPTCDPLAQDCPSANDACYPIEDGFTCAPNAAGDTGKQNDPCEFINVCQPGLLCAGPELVGMGCLPGSQGCCTQFCELPDGACPNPDQKCVAWYDPANIPAEAPVNALDIGFCGVMQ